MPTAEADVVEQEEGSTLLEGRSVPPFWIYRRYDTHTTRAIGFPPLFLHRSPAPEHPEKLLHLDASLTFGWYSKSTGRRRWINPAALFFGGFSERKTVWGAVPLLMGYRRVGEQFNFGQFPLVWWWGTKFVKNFLVIPFHYQQKSPDGFRGVSALLFWYGHKNLDDANLDNDRRHFVAAPVFWRFQRGLKRFDFGILYVGGENKLVGKQYMAVAPLFVWQEAEFGNKRDLWTIPWIRRVDRARRRSAWAVPPALTFRHQDPERTIFSATPLFWRTSNALRGSRLTLAGPVGLYDDPQQRNAFVAPLWYRFHDKATDATTQFLVPLYLARRTPQSRSVWTILGGGRKTQRGWGFAVPPALSFGVQRDDGSRLATIGGLLWHARRPATEGRPGASMWFAGPLGYGGTWGDRTHLGLPALLSFAGWGEGKHYQVVTPLFWHVRDAAAARRTVVAGPFYHHKDKGGLDGGLVPLAFWGRNDRYRYGVVPWILFADVTDVPASRRLTLSPFFVRSAGPDHRTLGVLGLGWDVKREQERHTAVFPFFYRSKKPGQSLLLTPVGGRRQVGDLVTSVYGPVYRRKGQGRDGWGVLPLLYHDSRPVPGGVARHTAFVPLFLRRRTPTDDFDIYSPLVWRRVVRGDNPRRGLAVVPFYFRQRQPGGVDVDAGLPWFFSRDRRRRTHTLVIGTGFHRLSRTQLNAGVAPLWWWKDSEEKRRLLALPAIFHFEDKTKDEHTTVAIPFWFDRQRANGRRTWAAFPFVFGGKRLYNFTRFSLAPPGYVDVFRLQKNVRFTGFVPFGFRYQKCGFQAEDDPSCRYTLWGSVPFFLYGKDGQGRLTHGALMAYYYDRSPEGWKLYTPVFGINNQPGKTLGWYAGPLGVKTTNTHRRVLLFPLYYRRAHRLENKSLTLVAPPLFIGRQRKDRSFFEAGLLVWQFRQQHKVSLAVAPPIFFYSHAWKQRRLYWVLPLFVRDNNMGKDEAWLSIPPALYVQRRKGENLDFVQFPLVWHIERGQNQGTFGAFAWWDIRVRGTMVQLVPGAFFRLANEQRDLKVVGPGLAWWSRGKGVYEGVRSWRILFGLFGAGVDEGRRYVTVFGARVDRGPAAAASPGEPTSRSSARAQRRAQRKLQRKTRRAQRRLNRQARQAERQERRQARQAARELKRQARQAQRAERRQARSRARSSAQAVR